VVEVSHRLSDPGRFGQPTYEAHRLSILETLPVDLVDYTLTEDRELDYQPDDHDPAKWLAQCI
jgi:hypothetical protein